jgi:hypothetical protein
MERNKWETAIRCLEIALHPNTNDDEVIAAVNGFRRTADGTPLGNVCVEFVGSSGPGAYPMEWREKLDRLNRENLDLRHKLKVAESNQSVAVRHVNEEAEQRAHELRAKLLDAEQRANEAEQRLAEFRMAYARISDDLKHEIFGLRDALAKQTPAELPVQRATPPFQTLLAEAFLGEDQTTIAHRPPMFAGGRESNDSPISGPRQDRPWTA